MAVVPVFTYKAPTPGALGFLPHILGWLCVYGVLGFSTEDLEF